MFTATAGLQPSDGCHEWYHEQCEVIPIAAWNDPVLKWYCGLVNLLSNDVMS